MRSAFNCLNHQVEVLMSDLMSKSKGRCIRLNRLVDQESELEAKMLELNGSVQRLNMLIMDSQFTGTGFILAFRAKKTEVTAELHRHRKIIDSVRFEMQELRDDIEGKDPPSW